MKNLIFKGMILVGSALTLSSFVSIEQKVQIMRPCCEYEAQMGVIMLEGIYQGLTGRPLTQAEREEAYKTLLKDCEKKEDLISNPI